MSLLYYLPIRGAFIVVGKESDADSVRLIADDADLYQCLKRAYSIKPSRGPSGDGSVQLRFEAVDAPEVHYGQAEQPLGAEARDLLLEWMGFGDGEFGRPNQPNRVTGAEPATGIAGAILLKGADSHGPSRTFCLTRTPAACETESRRG